MAWKKINDLNWQYDNDPPNPGGALTTLWETGTSGIRTNQSGDELYTNCRIVGSNMDSVPNELNKTYWDGESLKLYNEVLELDPIVSSQAPASTRPVQQGQVCEFDGVNDVIESSITSWTTSQASVACWIKTTNTGNEAIATQWSSNSGWWFRIKAGKIEIYTSAGLRFASADTYNTGEWIHVAISYGLSTANNKLWINGALEEEIGTSAGWSTATTPVLIGGLSASGYNYNGEISNIIIDNQIWSDADALALYNGTYTGALIQYNLNHASGTTAYDSSGNGNHGTLKNGAAFVVDNTLPPEADKLNLEGFTYYNRLGLTGTNSWGSAVAISDHALTSDFELSVIIERTDKHVFFAVDSSPLLSYAREDPSHAIYTNNIAGFQIQESGINRGTYGSYAVGDRVSIRRTGTTIYYLVNGSVNYTSPTSATGTLYPVIVGYSSGVTFGAAFDDSGAVIYNSFKNSVAYDYYIPRDESEPSNDIFGNPLQYSGSVYPRRPEYRNSYAASFDGSNDRLECSTNALVRRGNVVEFKVKVDYQVNQTTHIINTQHSSNASTCFAPRLMVNHNNNQIRFYGCRGAPFPYWNIDSSFYGVWHTIKLRMHNTNGTFIYLSIDGGDEVRIDANITTSPGDWGGTRDTYWAFGTGKNMELSDVKIFTTESDYNSNNPIIHHPLTEGAGDTVYDVSGNGNHGTINDASTGTEGAGFWAGRIDGEANALNNNNGFSKRMFFDGVDDEVELPNDAFNAQSAGYIEADVLCVGGGNYTVFGVASSNTSNQILSMQILDTNKIRVGYGGANFVQGTTVLTSGERYRIKWESTGTEWKIYIDGVEETTNVQIGSNTGQWFDEITSGSTRYSVGLLPRSTGNSSIFKGTVYNLIINNGTADIASYNGYGNTDADWIDQIGSNNGTVNGSPALLRIPADTSEPTKDVFGDTLTNPAITDGYNGSETELDAYNIAEGDNPSPATSGHSALDAIESGTEFTSDDSVYNRITSAAEDDRLITFTEDLTGDDKTLAEKYTQNP